MLKRLAHHSTRNNQNEELLPAPPVVRDARSRHPQERGTPSRVSHHAARPPRRSQALAGPSRGYTNVAEQKIPSTPRTYASATQFRILVSTIVMRKGRAITTGTTGIKRLLGSLLGLSKTARALSSEFRQRADGLPQELTPRISGKCVRRCIGQNHLLAFHRRRCWLEWCRDD